MTSRVKLRVLQKQRLGIPAHDDVRLALEGALAKFISLRTGPFGRCDSSWC
jgi:hypothetical protein